MKEKALVQMKYLNKDIIMKVNSSGVDAHMDGCLYSFGKDVSLVQICDYFENETVAVEGETT